MQNRKFPEVGGLFGFLTLLGGFLLIWLFPKLFYEDVPQRVIGDVNQWLKENDNKLFYHVANYTNRKGVLTQYISFYIYVPTVSCGRKFVDITSDISLDMKHSNICTDKNSKYFTSWIMKDFDIIEFNQRLNSKYGKEVKLIRVDSDFLCL